MERAVSQTLHPSGSGHFSGLKAIYVSWREAPDFMLIL